MPGMDSNNTTADTKLKADRRVAEASLRLIQSSDFQVILDWLTNELVSQREQNDGLDGNDLYRGQGEAKRLNKILQTIDNADAVMARIARLQSERVRRLSAR